MRDRRRSAGAAVLALAMAGALTGCLSVPHSGKVQGAGGNATTPASNVANEARIEAAPPAPGEEPEDIVRDFYGAMVDFSGDEVAMKYLVLGAQRPWKQMPTSTVVVADVKDPEPSPTAARTDSSATFVLHFTKLGEVLTDHEFVAGTDSLTDTVELVRDAGQDGNWRISRILSTDGSGSTVPAVLRLSVADFNSVFHEATLYFPRVGKDTTQIADRRWFPKRRADLPDAIAQAYIDGPGSFLKPDPSVTALLPAGTTVGTSGQLPAGQAGVAFVVPDGANSEGLRSQITTAISATFSESDEFKDVTGIVVNVNGQPERVGPDAGPSDLSSTTTVGDSWFIDGHHVLRPWFGTATSSEGAPDATAKLDVTGTQAVSLSPNAQLAAGAFVTGDGTSGIRVVSRDLGPHEVPLHASALTSVRWNADGSGIWVAGAVGGTPAVAARPAVGGKPAVDAVAASGGTAAAWFVSVTVTGEGSSASMFVVDQPVALDPDIAGTGNVLIDLRPSPDGIRITAIVQSGNKKRSDLFVGRIDKTGRSLSLVSFSRVAPVLLQAPKDKSTPQFSVVAAMWRDAQWLVLVARQGTASYSLWDASFDGSSVQPRNTTGLVNISDATVFALIAGKHMLALDNSKKRQVYELNGGTWQPISAREDKAKVLGLMYPGS